MFKRFGMSGTEQTSHFGILFIEIAVGHAKKQNISDTQYIDARTD